MTPATKVVATAPMPGIITPSFPFAGAMRSCGFAPLDALCSGFTSTIAGFDALFADFFRVAIVLAVSSVRIRMDM